MAASHFGFAAELRTCHLEFRVYEKRIVAETVFACEVEADVAFPGAADHDIFLPWLYQCHTAAEACCALFKGNSFQLGQKLAIIALILDEDL